MGNNNATAILTEEESSKLETNGMSLLASVSVETTHDQVILAGGVRDEDKEKEKESSELETNGMYLDSVPLETTQDPVFLAGEVRDGDKEKESSELETNGMYLDSVPLGSRQDQVSLTGEVRDGDRETEKESSKIETNGMSSLDSISVETTHDGEEREDRESCPDGAEEAELQSKELVDELKVKMTEAEMNPNSLESLVMENDEQIQKQTSVSEGIETVCEEIKVEEFSMIKTQSVVSKLNMTESGNEEKLCVVDETDFVSPSFSETVGTQESRVHESLEEETILSEEVVKLDQETSVEQTIIGNEGVPEMESQDFLKLDHDEVTNEGKVQKAKANLVSQESNVIKETGLGVYKEDKEMESEREARVKRMARCRSLPVSHNSRVNGDLLVTFPSRTKMVLEQANTSETLLTPCAGRNKAQEATEAESTKEAIEMRSPSFNEDQRMEERSNETTEKTFLHCQDKTEIYETTIDVEEKTVMLKRSESMKTRGIDRSQGFLKQQSDSYKETSDSGDNLLEKKASSGSVKGIVRKRTKSLLLGTCLCCTTTMN